MHTNLILQFTPTLYSSTLVIKLLITLLFFGSNSQHASLLRPHLSIVSMTKKLKRNGTCLIGYSGFISCEWLLIVWGAGTHTHIHIPTSWTKKFQAHTWLKIGINGEAKCAHDKRRILHELSCVENSIASSYLWIDSHLYLEI